MEQLFLANKQQAAMDNAGRDVSRADLKVV